MVNHFVQKQQIYIKEIERANDQLKQTASEMFAQKGFSKEQTDLFLKKVNFMENREYFMQKRKYMSLDDSATVLSDENVPSRSDGGFYDKKMGRFGNKGNVIVSHTVEPR